MYQVNSLMKRLLVHRADVGKAFLFEIKREVAGDETARAGDDDQIVLLQRSILFYGPFLLLHKDVWVDVFVPNMATIGISIQT